MDLQKALDVLAASPQDIEDVNQRKDKVDICRVVVEQVCSPTVRSAIEFPRLLSSSLAQLLRAVGDKDLSVYSVAEESLNKTIKVLIPIYHERILFELFKVIKGRPSDQAPSAPPSATPPLTSTGHPPSTASATNIIFPPRSQRVALVRFGDVCGHIRPSKSRKYMTSLLPAMYSIVQQQSSDEGMMEALAASMVNISSVLLPYLKEAEVTQVIDMFVKLLDNDSAAVRRSGAACIVCICRSYPKLQLNASLTAMAAATKQLPPPTTPSGTLVLKSSASLLGALFGFLQLAKLTYEYSPAGKAATNSSLISGNAVSINSTISSPDLEGDHLSTYIRYLVDVVSVSCMEHATTSGGAPYDHNLVGAGLELLQQILVSHGRYPTLWPADTVKRLVNLLRTLAYELPSSRVSTQAVSITCISYLAKHHPLIMASELVEHKPPHSQVDVETPSGPSSPYYMRHVGSDDPLLRGSTAFLLGCMSRGFLEHDRVTSNTLFPCDGATPANAKPELARLLDMPAVVDMLLSLAADPSSVTSRLATGGLAECLGLLLTGRVPHGTLGLRAMRTILTSVQPSTYWLVKVDILETLARMDYRVVRYLEEDVLQRAFGSEGLTPGHGHDDKATQENSVLEGSTPISLQTRVLAFIFGLLGDSDGRVRHGASCALVDMLPRLCFPPQLERHSLRGAVAYLYDSSGVTCTYPHPGSSRREVHTALAHLVNKLVNELGEAHPDDHLRGCYHALSVLAQTYTFPPHTPRIAMSPHSVALPNPLTCFLGDLFPLALDRLGVSWVATDLETHTDIIAAVGYMCRNSGRMIAAHWTPILRHLLRMLSMMAHIVQFKPAPVAAKEEGLSAGLVAGIRQDKPALGNFMHSGHYLKIYHKLLAAWNTALTSFGAVSRFQPLRHVLLTTLAATIRVGGKNIIPYNEEIISYLTPHFEQDPTGVIACVHELFLTTFRPTPLAATPTIIPAPSAAGWGWASNAPSSSGPTSAGSGAPSPTIAAPTSATSAAKSVLGIRPQISLSPHDEVFSNNKSVFAPFLMAAHTPGASPGGEPPGVPSLEVFSSHLLDVTYSIAEIERLVSTESNRIQIRMFEPLVLGAIQLYQVTHTLSLKQAILSMLSQLVKFGVDFARLDKDQGFLLHITDEIGENHAYLASSGSLLPYQFDFISVLYFVRRHLPDLLTAESMKKLMCISVPPPSATPSPPPGTGRSYGLPTLLSSFQSFIRYLYNPTDKYPDNELRPCVLSFLIGHMHNQPAAVEQLSLILSLVRPNAALWTTYSQKIIDRLIPLLSLEGVDLNSTAPTTQTSLRISTFAHLESVYGLMDRLNMASFTASRWADALLALPPFEEAQSSTPQKLRRGSSPVTPARPLGPPAPESPRSSSLVGRLLDDDLLGLYNMTWLPRVVLLIRVGSLFPEEARISGARQSLHLPTHDPSQTLQSSANIIARLIFRILERALAKTIAPDAVGYRFGITLLTHLLHFMACFLQRGGVPYVHQASLDPSKQQTTSLFLDAVKLQVPPAVVFQIANDVFSIGRIGPSLYLSKLLLVLTASNPLAPAPVDGYSMAIVGIHQESCWRRFVCSGGWRRAGCEQYVGQHIIFLMYCQMLVLNKAKLDDLKLDPHGPQTSSFLSKVLFHIHEPTVRKVLDQQPLGALLLPHLRSLLEHTTTMDLGRKLKLLKCLSYLPPSKESISVLISYFLQTDDVSLQIAAERVLGLQLNRLLDVSGDHAAAGADVSALYTLFLKRFHRSATNLAVKALFEKLIRYLSKNCPDLLSILPPPPEASLHALAAKQRAYMTTHIPQRKNVLNTLAPSQFHEFLSSYYTRSPTPVPPSDPFTHLAVMAQIDTLTLARMLRDDKIDISLLPPFIASPHSRPLKDQLQQLLVDKMQVILGDEANNPHKSKEAYAPPRWEDLFQTCRYATYILNTFSIGTVPFSQLLKLCVWGFQGALRRWAVQVGNPYNFKIILEMACALISHARSPSPTVPLFTHIVQDRLWSSLMICFYQLYSVMVRPHFGFLDRVHDLEATLRAQQHVLGRLDESGNFPPPPPAGDEDKTDQVAQMPILELIKFLLSLLADDTLLHVTTGSHIGQLIFDSFSRVLIALAKQGYDLIYPTEASAGLDPSEPVGLMPHLPLFSKQPEPEKAMTVLVRYVNLVGFPSLQVYHQLIDMFDKIYAAPLGENEETGDEITEHLHVLALNGMTSLVVKHALEIETPTSTVNIRTPDEGPGTTNNEKVHVVDSDVAMLETVMLTSPHYIHTPRDKDIAFLSTEAGMRLASLQEIIHGRLPALLAASSQTHVLPSTRASLKPSPYHFNIERSFNCNGLGYGQLSIRDLREFPKRSWRSSEIDVAPLVDQLVGSFEHKLAIPVSSNNEPALRVAILRATVMLSDLFNTRAQFEWMLRCFQKLLDQDEAEDFLIRQSLVVGYLKAFAVLAPEIIDPVQIQYIIDLVRTSLESPNTTVQISVMAGLMYLLEAKMSKLFTNALLQVLFKQITSRLVPSLSPNSPPAPPSISSTSTMPLDVHLHLLSLSFMLIEQFPRECMESSFTKKALGLILAMGTDPQVPSPILYAVFRGLNRLLISFCLSHAHRESIIQFAQKFLTQDSSLHSLLALGLMLTIMYTGDESTNVKSTSNTPSASVQTSTESYLSSQSSMGSFSSFNMSAEGGLSEMMGSMLDVSQPGTDALSASSQVTNMERVKHLMDRVRQVGYLSQEASTLQEIIPRVLVDVAPSNDQVLSFILGEFLRQNRANPRLIAYILFETLGHLQAKGEQNLIVHWVSICLPNYTQLASLSQGHSLWALTSLFLAASHVPELRLLFHECTTKVQADDSIFLLAATEFYNSLYMTEATRKAFATAFVPLKGEPFTTLNALTV